MSALFTLAPSCWYGWQMVPGYGGTRCVPHFSPIYITRVAPQKSGKSVIRIGFVNVLYAQGVQDFEVDIRVTTRSANFLMGVLVEDHPPETARGAVISHIEFEWLRRFCPSVFEHRSPESCSPAAHGSVSFYLDEVFRGRAL